MNKCENSLDVYNGAIFLLLLYITLWHALEVSISPPTCSRGQNITPPPSTDTVFDWIRTALACF